MYVFGWGCAFWKTWMKRHGLWKTQYISWLWSHTNVGVYANWSKEQNQLHRGGKKEGVCKKQQAEFDCSVLCIKVSYGNSALRFWPSRWGDLWSHYRTYMAEIIVSKVLRISSQNSSKLNNWKTKTGYQQGLAAKKGNVLFKIQPFLCYLTFSLVTFK